MQNYKKFDMIHIKRSNNMTFEEILAENDELISALSQQVYNCDQIENELYEKYKVFRGLRDKNGVGVVTGLTEISEMNGFKKNEEGVRVPIEGEMYYRGINIYDIVNGIKKDSRFGYEESAYVLLCGNLPNKKELEQFNQLLTKFRTLPDNFVRDIILKAPSCDMMNALSRSILTLYSYDPQADDISIKNVFRQSLQLIAQMPLLAVYSYQAHKYHHLGKNLHIRQPKKDLSTAENILYMLNGKNYTKEQARILDICMILQAEHGGGNNSTFTTHVVTSSGTDTYSCVAASLGSLKGPRHGGANRKVAQMMNDILENVDELTDENITAYLRRILNKEVFDKLGLVYGLGHAVYSLSDPRANILSDEITNYMKGKEHDRSYTLYFKLKDLAPATISENRTIYKGVSVNIDYFTGYIYKLLNIPEELFTPIFAVSRISGWAAHRLEELSNKGKIIRPAYIAVAPHTDYIPLNDRK